MSILYALVASRDHILASYTLHDGNFEQIVTMLYMKYYESSSKT